MPEKRCERPKRMNLKIPLPTYELMHAECARRSELAGGTISFSMLVVQVMNDLLGNHKTDKRPSAQSAGLHATQ